MLLAIAGNRPRGVIVRSMSSSEAGWREFRWMAVAEGASVVGDQLAKVGLSVLVFERTHSPALTGLTYALTLLPDLIAGPLLSGLADRLPRRRVMVGCAAAQACLVALMLLPGAPFALLATAVALVAALQAPFKAAQTGSVRELLGTARNTSGQMKLTTIRELGQLVGLAGAAAVVGLVGTKLALGVDAVSFVLAAVVLRLGIHARPAARSVGSPPHPRYACTVLWEDRELRALTWLVLLGGLAVLPESVIVPLTAELGAPLWTTGLLLAADPLGLVLAASVLGSRNRSRNLQRLLIGPAALLCMAPLIVFLGRPAPMVAGLLLLLSGAGASYQALAKGAMVERLPDAVTGAAVGLVRTGLRAGQGIGAALGGVLAEWCGSASAAIALAGGIGAAGAALGAVLWERSRLTTQEVLVG